MRELSPNQRQALLRLIVERRFDRALVTLYVLGEALDAGAPGRQEHRYVVWRRTETNAATGQLGPDDLNEGDLDLWNPVVGALQLLRALDERLFGDWQTASEQVRRVAALDGSEHWIVRKHTPPPTREDNLVGLAGQLRHFRVVPAVIGDFQIEIVPAPLALDARLRLAVRQEPQAFIGHFTSGVAVQWGRSWSGEVQALGLQDEVLQLQAALALLKQAAGAVFFVLPECVAPRAMRQKLGAAIAAMGEEAPLLSLPGSFHDPMPDCTPAFENRCELRDYRGTTLIDHAKTRMAAVHHGQDAEHIHLCNTLHILVTAAGTIGIAICLEFSHPSGDCYQAWSRIGPQWMLVPSMGEASTLDLHKGVAKQLVDTHRTNCLIANQSPSGSGLHGGFAYWAAGMQRNVNQPFRIDLTVL
jgi:hypothetical protein